MADDHVLSMSLDDIIKLKKKGSSSETRQNTSIGARGNGARGATYQVKMGKPRITGARAQIRRRGGRTLVVNASTRGANWNQGSNIGRGQFARYRNVNKNNQRQYQIALGKSKLQMAKRFLRMRQRGRTTGIASRNAVLTPRLSVRGVRGIRGQRFRRGRIGVQSPRLIPNSFRSDQLIRLSRLNVYRNKVNRKLSSTRVNQGAAGPSLIVSIENERAGMSTSPNIRIRGRRRGGITGTMRQAYGRTPVMSYQQRNTLPYHTGALNPEIQMVIAGIQGKNNQTSYGTSNPGSRRGGGRRRGEAGGRGFGGFSRRGRTQLPVGFDNSGRLGLPLGVTGNTLNERFSGLR